ncbi:MAG: tetratricopeptide repeat protein [Planctomycetes bacterium]|nr:tetratricopeptide repeat protein [Planctomycetota bacterium]
MAADRTPHLLLAPLALLLLAGCVTGPDSDPGQARAPGRAGQKAPLEAEDDDNLPVVPTTDPERTRIAREMYLRGVRLLSGSPRIDEAIREFQQSLEIDPLFYRAHFKLGICYYMKGQYPLEINEYKKCLAINPQYVPAWLNLGHAYLARDGLEQARAAYERVLEINPHHAVALYNKALIEFDLHNEPESRRLFQQFLHVDGEGEMGERARQYLTELDRRGG